MIKDKFNGNKDNKENELKKLKREELLKIMLAQGEEIDRLKQRVDELEKELANRELKFTKAGSLAEASLLATDFFKETEKAAALYLENVKRMVDQEYGVQSEQPEIVEQQQDEPHDAQPEQADELQYSEDPQDESDPQDEESI